MVLFGSLIGGTIGLLLEVVALLVILSAGGLLLLRLVNKNAANSWVHLGRTKAGQAGAYAQSIDPTGQMRQSAMDAAEELKGADDALIQSDKLVQRLSRQVAADKQTMAKLQGQIAKDIQPTSEGGKGLSETTGSVIEKLKRVRDLKNAIAENETQIELQKTLYKKTLDKANAASQKIAGAIQRADRMKVQLDLGSQTAKINDMLSKYNPAGVNNKLANIDRYEQEAQSQLDGYASAARVAADRDMGTDDDDVTPDTDEELGGLLDEIKARNRR